MAPGSLFVFFFLILGLMLIPWYRDREVMSGDYAQKTRALHLPPARPPDLVLVPSVTCLPRPLAHRALPPFWHHGVLGLSLVFRSLAGPTDVCSGRRVWDMGYLSSLFTAL